MTIGEIVKECEETLIELGVPHAFVGKQVENHFKMKSGLLARMQLTEENNYRFIHSMQVTAQTKPDLFSFLKYVEHVSGGEYTFHDFSYMKQGKNVVKVSSVVLKFWDKLRDGCGERLPDKLIKGREYFVTNWHKNKGHLGSHSFVCALGDELRSKRNIILSGNPVDYLCSSGPPYATFSTCIKPTGEYFNTVFDYLNSDCVLISFLTEDVQPKKKLGRQFVYVHENAFAQTRLFGAMNQSDQDLLTKHIRELLGGKWSMTTPCSKHFILERTPYIDYQGVLLYRTDKEFQPFRIKQGMCNQCGKLLAGGHGKSGVCSACWGHLPKCGACSAVCLNSKYTFGNRVFCETCRAAHFKPCADCKTEVYKNDMFCFGSRHVCSACFNKVAFVCKKCLCTYENQFKVEYDGELYCKECFHGWHRHCSVCNEYFHRHNAFVDINTSKYTCFRCFTKEKRKKNAK